MTIKVDPFKIQRQIKERMLGLGYKLEYGKEDSIYKCRVIRPDNSVIVVNVASLENALLPQDEKISKTMDAFWKSIDEHIFDKPDRQDTEEDEEDGEAETES